MKYNPQKLIEKQKIEKEASKLQEKLNKRALSIREQYDSLKEKAIAKIHSRYDKKLEKRLKKISSQYDKMRINKKKKIKGIEVKKVDKTNWKEKANHEVQLYAKLSRAYILDWDIVILLVDKQKLVKLFKDNGMMDWTIQGWHVYGKKNFPHMIYLVNNIYPITSWTNKMQGDQIAQRKTKLGKWMEEELQRISENDQAKNDLRDTNFFMEKYNFFMEKNLKECKRLGLDYNKSKPKKV